jgi:hypothetical protein
MLVVQFDVIAYFIIEVGREKKELVHAMRSTGPLNK